MNLTFLKYFTDTAKESSVLKSATINHVSSPAISNGIRKLEEELGVSLLKHGRNKIELTKEGISLFKSANEIFSLIEKTKKQILSGVKEEGEHITLGITNGLNQEFWAPFLKHFGVKYPNYQINFKIGPPTQLKSWIQDKEIDFALTITREASKNYESIMIHKGKFKFITHPNLKRTKTPQSFILTSNWPEVESFKKAYFKKNKIMPTIKYEVEGWETIKNLVSQEMGIGIVPDYHLLKKSLTIKEYAYPLELSEYQIAGLFLKGNHLSAGSYILIKEFKEYILK